MEYTYDERNKPLSVTYKGETFWYVYNGHGDVVALTDINGQVAARYEYDEWGLPTKMYNRYGERVREGIGWIGDLNTGNGTPGSKNEETDNDEIDQHPGNGNTKEKTNNKDKNPTKTDNAGITVENVEITVEEETIEEITTEEATIDDEVTADITTDLVKENPYRYSGYYFDRKTQFYYLQARYYDARIGRFISLDSWDGNISNPLSLNKYIYSLNNPINFIDSTGLKPLEFADSISKTGSEMVYEIETTYRDNATKQAQAYLQYMGFDIGKEGIDGISGAPHETWQSIKTFQDMVGLEVTGHITGFDDPTLTKMKEATLKNWNINQNIFKLNSELVKDENSGLIMPVYGGRLSDAMRWRKGWEKEHWHNGIDIGGESGSLNGMPLYAPASGKLRYKPNNLGAGNTADIITTIGGVQYKLRHFHMQNFENLEIYHRWMKSKDTIKEGKETYKVIDVDQGDFIGYVGKTPDVAAHLHFGILEFNKSYGDINNYLDPLDYLPIDQGQIPTTYKKIVFPIDPNSEEVRQEYSRFW